MIRRSAPGPRPLTVAALVLAAAVATLVGPFEVLGNGGTLRLANVPMGDYRVSVFTDPTPVRPDSLDVSVLIVQDGREGVAEGVDVMVRATFLGGEATPRARRATREQAEDPRYYAAKFALGLEGPWRITVEVSGDHGEGAASFQVTAREPGFLGHPLVLSLLALLPLAALGWWLLREEEAEDEVSRAARPIAS
jgi:hypothetical protein